MKELICITCPRGCHLTVDEKNKTVTGNTCKRGEVYGLQEVLNPKRVITSTVTIIGADLKRLPVRTDKPIDKELMFKKYFTDSPIFPYSIEINITFSKI